MKNKKFRWFRWIGLLFVIILTAVFFYVKHEVDHILGGNTKVIPSGQFEVPLKDMAIINVNVLASNADTMLERRMVLINDGIISKIDTVSNVPENYDVIDGTGKYLIPGLIDPHVHLKKGKNDLLLYLANGITHIGEMTGMEEHLAWRKEIEKGALGPDLFIASPKITSKGDMKATFRSWFEKRHVNFTSAEAVRKGIRAYKKKGFDALKMSTFLNREVYDAISDEAEKVEMDVIGHIPFGMNLDDIFFSRQSQLAHVSEITKSISWEYQSRKSIYFDNIDDYLGHVQSIADSVAQRLKENNISVVSTLWIHETKALQELDTKNFLKSIELEFMNPGWVEGSLISSGWLPENNVKEQSDDKERERTEVYWNTQYEAQRIITQALIKEGVNLIIGTDANGAVGVIPGFSLHDEMEVLHRQGMSNAQILKATTKIPAEWMKITSGVVEEGYQADLLLLDKNPLENISNTRSIHSVINNGKLISRKVIDEILRKIKQANDLSREKAIDEYIQ